MQAQIYRYNALDALQLISLEDEYFHCESCNGELVAESDKLASQEVGDGDSNARRQRREKLKDMLQNMEVCLVFVCLLFVLVSYNNDLISLLFAFSFLKFAITYICGYQDARDI